MDQKYEKKLTDRLYLTALQEMKQMSLSYMYENGSFFSMVDETVFGAGFDDRFVIVERHPCQYPGPVCRDTTLYYIIDIQALKKERSAFVQSTDTIRYRSLHKDVNGRDSLGQEQVQISTSAYAPTQPDPLTYTQFIQKRKDLNISPGLAFTTVFHELK